MSILVQLNDRNHQNSLEFDRELDARGLSCPLPILNTRKSLEGLKPGEVLKIVVTDRGSVSFFESLTRQNDLKLITWQEQDGEYAFFIRKS